MKYFSFSGPGQAGTSAGLPGTPLYSSPGTSRLNTPVNSAMTRPFRPPGSGQQQAMPRLWSQQNTPRFTGNHQNSPQFTGNSSRFPKQQGTPRLSGQPQNTSSFPRQSNVTPRFQGQQNSPRFGGQQLGTPRFQGQQNTPRITGQQNGNRMPGQQQNSSPRFPGQQHGNQRFTAQPRTPNTPSMPNFQVQRGQPSQGNLCGVTRVQAPVANSQDRGCVIIRPSGSSSNQGRQPFSANSQQAPAVNRGCVIVRPSGSSSSQAMQPFSSNSQQSGPHRPNGPRTPGPSRPQTSNMAQPYGQTSNTYQRPSGPQNSGPNGPNTNRFQGPMPGSHNTILPRSAYNTNQNRPQNVSNIQRFQSGTAQNHPSGPTSQSMNSPRVATPRHMQDQNVAKSSPGGGKFTFKKPVPSSQVAPTQPPLPASQAQQSFQGMGTSTMRGQAPSNSQQFRPRTPGQLNRVVGPNTSAGPSGHPPVRPQDGAIKPIIKPQGGATKPSGGHFETADLWQDGDDMDQFLTDLETEF